MELSQGGSFYVDTISATKARESFPRRRLSGSRPRMPVIVPEPCSGVVLAEGISPCCRQLSSNKCLIPQYTQCQTEAPSSLRYRAARLKDWPKCIAFSLQRQAPRATQGTCEVCHVMHDLFLEHVKYCKKMLILYLLGI